MLLGNGDQISINSVGTMELNIDSECVLSLNNVLHTSSIAANSLFVNKLFVDNQVLVEFDSFSFCVKNL